jgi:hypothetical protein
LCGAPHSGDHDAEYHGNLTEQHVRPLHDLASDFSCADSSLESSTHSCRTGEDQSWVRCRSKTFIGRKVEEKARVRAVAKEEETPQARAHCGV